MQSRIRILKDHIINQIAAGEVIEHPASVVKELVENAIDAKATDISVETKNAGRALIRVCDNGDGMGHDDLLLCLSRHATSKLVNFEEIFSLPTLGFRGEALPSIASISKLKIISAKEKAEEAYALYQEGGNVRNIKQAQRGKGTTVEVSSLFYNVPVRKKFAKTLSYDVSSIHKTLILQALSHSNVGFRWIHDDKEQFCVPPSSSCDIYRIQALLGNKFSEELSPFIFSEGEFILEGYLGKNFASRSHKGHQYLFINHRPVISPLISSILKESASTRIAENRYPLFIFYFSLPPQFLDINVHPQKKEVRFQDDEKIRNFFLKAMANESRIPSSFFTPKEEEEALKWAAPQSYTPVKKDFYFSSTFSKNTDVIKLPLKEAIIVIAVVKQFLILEAGMLPFFGEDSLLAIVDAKKAIQKIAIINMEKACDQNSACISSQILLVPITLELTKEQFRIVTQEISFFQKLGIGISLLSGSSIMIDALPPSFAVHQTETRILELIQDLSEERYSDETEKRRKIIHRLASYYFPSPLTKEIGAALIEKLLKCQNPCYTMHGEMIIKGLNEKDLEKWMLKNI